MNSKNGAVSVTGPDERYDREVECHNSDGSVFWIHEGVGVDWWFEQRDIPEIQAPGWYVIEGIVATITAVAASLRTTTRSGSTSACGRRPQKRSPPRPCAT